MAGIMKGMVYMKIEKTLIISVLILILSISTFAQDLNQLDWLNDLDGKSAATYGDAVKIFAIQTSGRSSSFRADSSLLEKSGIALDGYSEGEELSRGMLAKMTARYLDLGGSLMYMVFGAERYAFKACVAEGIMRGDASENDIISGPELVEVLGRVSEIRGDR